VRFTELPTVPEHDHRVRISRLDTRTPLSYVIIRVPVMRVGLRTHLIKALPAHLRCESLPSEAHVEVSDVGVQVPL